MGAKSWMLIACDGTVREALTSDPTLDRDATRALAHKLFPNEKLRELDDVTLSDTAPSDNELVIGCFPGATVLASMECGNDLPSRLAPQLRNISPHRTVCLHAIYGVVDWCAFAIWKDGQLVRSLSLSSDRDVMEDIGQRLPFEEPYWAGQHPVLDEEEDKADYPFDFHPLEFGEAARRALFGYEVEGGADDGQFDPESVALMRFKRSRRWWPFWPGR